MTSENEIKENKVIEIAYYKPSFWKRVFAIIFDFIIAFFVIALSFLAIRASVNSFSKVKEYNELVQSTRLDSKLYVEDGDKLVDVVTYYMNAKDVSNGAKEVLLNRTVNSFIAYVKENAKEEDYLALLKDYDKERLSNKLKYNNESYFILDENNKVIKNNEAEIPSKRYIEDFYNPFIDTFCQGYLTTKFPKYVEAQKIISYVLIFGEIPGAIIIGMTLIFYVVPLCFSRGKQTFGRFFFKIGLVDKNVLSVNWKLFTLRFLIFLFGEIILSLFTLGVPLIISFSMMIITKNNQCFHDYMLSIREVDIESATIYRSIEEIGPTNSLYDVEKFKMR